MEVVCLNGQALIVKPVESLHDAKVKVAKALGAFPEAVEISCEGQILRGTGSLSDLVEVFKGESPPLFAVVNQDRMELGKHLDFFTNDLAAYWRGFCRCQDLSSELTQRQKVLSVHDLQEIQRTRQREQLKDLGNELADAVITWEDLRSNLEAKIWHVREELKKRLEGSEEFDQILLEFDDATSLHGRNCFDICTCCYCLGLPDEPLCESHLPDLCPRLLRRELWQRSKGSWKKIEKRREHRLDKAPPSSPKPSKNRRRMMCRDIKNQVSQLREQSLESEQ
eukprot:Skav225883  [mRNA]  locus=scaffold2702:65920:66762:- [translate_table: standard]